MHLSREDDEGAAYGVAVNGEGFGCHRCPYSKAAKNVDDHGRNRWCGYGGFHQTPMACYELNGAETFDDDDDEAMESMIAGRSLVRAYGTSGLS